MAHDRQQINRWLAHDSLFNVWTIEAGGWIDPFTGAVIKFQQNGHKAAKRHLLKNRPWMKFGQRTMPELQAIRWANHLQRWIEPDGRLRIFRKDGAWLNPYNGAWLPGVPLENGKVTYATVQEMAKLLAKTPGIDGTKPLDQTEIARLIQNVRTPSGRLTAVPPQSKREGGSALDDVIGIEAPVERNSDLHRAKAVIERMLPQLPTIDGWKMGMVYAPHSVIGGDFYDLIRIDERHLFLAMGDVSGHGTSAALVVASTLKSLRHAVREGGNLSEIIVRFNDDIHEDLLSSYFITMFGALVDLHTRVMTCVCAGHHPALLANPRRRSILIQLGNPAPAIGLMKGDIFVNHLEPMTVQLRSGDTILQFTDGLFEATNAEGQAYGRRRIMAALLLAMDDEPEVGVARLVGGVKKFAGDAFTDDVTAMMIKVLDKE